MRWEGQPESENVEDRRGMGPARVGGIGLGGIVLVLAISYFTGTNPLTLLNMINGVQEVTGPSMDQEPTTYWLTKRLTRQVCIRRSCRHRNDLGNRLTRTRPTV